MGPGRERELGKAGVSSAAPAPGSPPPRPPPWIPSEAVPGGQTQDSTFFSHPCFYDFKKVHWPRGLSLEAGGQSLGCCSRLSCLPSAPVSQNVPPGLLLSLPEALLLCFSPFLSCLFFSTFYLKIPNLVIKLPCS